MCGSQVPADRHHFCGHRLRTLTLGQRAALRTQWCLLPQPLQDSGLCHFPLAGLGVSTRTRDQMGLHTHL